METPLENSNPAETKETVPTIEKRTDVLVNPVEAARMAGETMDKIVFLRSIKDKVNGGVALGEEELARGRQLFGDREFKKGEIGSDIRFLEDDHYQQATAGTDGASFVQVAFPSGMYHKETQFGADLKKNEEGIKSLYHEAGTIIDRGTERVVHEHNAGDTSEKIGWSDKETHARRWFSVLVNDAEGEKSLVFTYGQDNFTLRKSQDGKWRCTPKSANVCLAAKSVCDGLAAVDQSVARTLEGRANQVLG